MTLLVVSMGDGVGGKDEKERGGEEGRAEGEGSEDDVLSLLR